MLSLLAQSAPPAEQLASWLEVLFYLGGFVATVLGGAVALKSLREKSESLPQPLHVKAADEFVTHVEFSELKADVEQIREEVKDGFRQLGEERRTSVGNLHGKIDETNVTVNQMRGELTLLNQQLQQLFSRQLK